MANRSNFEYTSGRGLPTYFLDRIATEPRVSIDGKPNITTGAVNNPYKSSSTVDSSISCSTSSTGDGLNTENMCLINSGENEGNCVSMSSNISFMDVSSNIPICLMKDVSENTNDPSIDNYHSNNIDGPETMFPPYTRLFSENEPDNAQLIHDTLNDLIDPDELEEGNDNNNSNVVELTAVDYQDCCLWGDDSVTTCGPTSRHYTNWSSPCIRFGQLNDIDIRSYLMRKKVISHFEDDNFIVTERNLIANRLRCRNILVSDGMFICPKHRSSYGIDWCDSKPRRNHPDHYLKKHSSGSGFRRANIATCSKIEGFPVGGRLCSKHRKEISMVPEDTPITPITTYTMTSGGSEFKIDNTRESVNRILAEANLSPIRSQARKRLVQYSNSGLRRITSKFSNTMRVITKKIAEAYAPGQSEELIQRCQLESNVEGIDVLEQNVTNEMISNLKQIYDHYVQQKMPFIEQVRLLSLLPRSWIYEKTIEIFGCSHHAIKVAHRMYDEQKYMLKQDDGPSIRQRIDPEKIKHFVNWLVESNTLVSGTYGLTVLRMDNGDKCEILKQILQLKKNHVLVNYKKYCNESNFESLGTSKLFDIINGIKPAQQKFVAGLDEFVVEGVEAWHALSSE